LDNDGQQHHQQLAHGRRLARQVIQTLNQSPDNGPRDREQKVDGNDATSGAFAIAALLLAALAAEPASAQKPGGVLKIYHRDSPASMSILEEVTNSTEIPMMGVFNNLVLYKQDVPQNSLQSIIPDLATDWAWNEDGSELMFRLRQGVKWHDGHPFTANDVKCTWDLLLGKSPEKLRANPRKAWYENVEGVTAEADLTATFHLKRPQPAIVALLASGYAPVYPCHVSPRDMRQHPIGTGAFKFVEFKPNEYIKVARNPDYWKKARPYPDGIEYTVIPNRSTAILSFIAGKFDMTFPFEVTVPLLRDVKTQAPQAICELVPANTYANLITNRDAPPFDKPEMRRALALALDRKAFIDILTKGHGDIGGAMQPPPEGVWGMPPEMLAALPGYDPDVQKNRAEAAASWKSSATAPTGGSRSRCRSATFRFPRFGGDPDRPAEGGVFRRRARADRHHQLFPEDPAQGIHGWPQPADEWARPRPDPRFFLRMWVEPELGRLLQPRGGQADRAAIDRGRPGTAQATGMGHRTQAGRGCRPADHLLQPPLVLLAALGQGATKGTSSSRW
jgi:ABC-type transport system substrate-binding protein